MDNLNIDELDKKADLLITLAWRRYDNLQFGESRLETKINMLLIANGLLIPFFSIVFQSSKNVIPFLLMSTLPFVSILWIICIISDSKGIAEPNFKKFVLDIEDQENYQIKTRIALSIDQFCDEIAKVTDKKTHNYSKLLLIFGATISGFVVSCLLLLIRGVI
jgi:hypothetical protein